MGQDAGAPSPAPQTNADGDADLLRQYVRHKSQAAFAELVRRYGGLVHATCLREVDNKQLVEDVTQVVFLLLARKAPSLLRVESLAGWLFRASRFSARNALRHERRRKIHEQEVIADMTQAHFNGPPLPSWDHLEPVLNSALASLRPHEQDVILLRYLEGASWRETAARLGLAEDAAQKRETRAVDKMRRFVNRQGLMLSLAALTALLSEEAARAVAKRGKDTTGEANEREKNAPGDAYTGAGSLPQPFFLLDANHSSRQLRAVSGRLHPAASVAAWGPV